MPPKETTTAMPDGEREKLVAAAAALVAKRAEQRAQLDKEQSRGSDVVAYTIAAVCFIALAVLLYLSIAPRPFLLPSELHGTWHVTQVDSTAVTDAVPFATNKRRTTFSSDDFDEDESPDVAALSAKTVGESKQAPVKLKYRFGATDVTTVTLNLTRYMDHDDVNDVLILASPKSTSADKKQDTTASSEAGDDAAPASAPTSSDLEPTYGDEVVVGESAGVVEMIPGFVALDLGRVPFTRQPMHAFSWTWSGPCYVPPSLADDGIASSSDEKVKVFVRADHKTCTVMYHLSRMVVSVFTTDPRVFDESEPGDMNTTSGGSIWVKTNEVSGKMDAPVVTYVLVSTVSRDMATDRKVKLVVMIVLIVVLLQLFLRSTKPGPNQRMAQEKLQLAQHRKRMEEARRTRAQ